MAINAHFEKQAAEKLQRDARRRLLLDTAGTASGKAAGVQLHNISTSGMLIECSEELAVGAKLEVELPEAGLTRASVVWNSGDLHGCRFDSAISFAALSAAQLKGAVSLSQADTIPIADQAGESFAARLQKLRKRKGLSMAQLGDAVGVSKPTVWAWEQGRAKPLDERLEAIASALGTSPEELVPSPNSPALQDMLARTREEIAHAYGTVPEKVRILIEL